MIQKSKLILVLILIINFNISAAKISYYDNGKIAIWAENYDNGNVNGRYIKYNENGNIDSDSYMKNNIYDGKYTNYYMSGKVNIKANYNMGKLNGKYIEYYENGKIKIETNYNNDEVEGEYIRYYESGNIEYKITYKNGMREGEHIKYYENGKVTAKGNYKKDKLINDYKIYEENEKYLPEINFEIEDGSNIIEASNEESDNTFVWIGYGDYLKSSSELAEEKGNNYYVKNIGDFNLKTAWIEGNSDYGIGEWIEKQFFIKEENSFYDLYGLKRIYIYNGYCKNEKTWKENSRVKKLKIYLNDIPYFILNLKDSMEEQSFKTYVPVDYGIGINKIKFEIMEVYPGEKYKDTAISEIILKECGICFPAQTKILSDNSFKTIDKLKSGDEVLTYNSADKKFVTTKVLSVAKVEHDNLIEIDFGDKIITSTDDHPYLSDNGWKSCKPNGTKHYKWYENVKELKAGDKIYFIGKDGKSELKEVKGIKKVDRKEMCYTITKLENGDNFIADGAVVGVEERREKRRK